MAAINAMLELINRFIGDVAFIGFSFLLSQGGERLVCRVTSPRRFPPPDHATGFEKFLRKGKSGRGLPQSKTLRDYRGRWEVRQVLDCASLLALWCRA
jgi:hypothetical protein